MEWLLERKAELGDFPPEGLEQVKCWSKKALEEMGRNGERAQVGKLAFSHDEDRECVKRDIKFKAEPTTERFDRLPIHSKIHILSLGNLISFIAQL